jgi:hypothetical protein
MPGTARRLERSRRGGFVFVLLGFPDGRLPSRRWRPAAWFVAAVYVLEALGFVMRADRVWGEPVRVAEPGLGPGPVPCSPSLAPADSAAAIIPPGSISPRPMSVPAVILHHERPGDSARLHNIVSEPVAAVPDTACLVSEGVACLDREAAGWGIGVSPYRRMVAAIIARACPGRAGLC